ncbi:translational activator of GCN4 [Malassezia sp. CBS 17886]|nr:translational activator of GCN4 [Malassezia sp. CBS 17886]
MRRRHIEQWLHDASGVAAASPYDSGDEMAPEHAASRAGAPAGAPADWDAFRAYVAALLRSGRPHARIAFLHAELPKLAQDADTTSHERIELYDALLGALHCHTDRGARVALLHGGDALLRADCTPEAPLASALVRHAAAQLCARVERTCTPTGTLRAPRAVLADEFAWVCALLRVVMEAPAAHLEGDAAWSALVAAFALAHDTLLHTATRRDRLLRGALHAAWRTIRETHARIPLLVRTLLAARDIAAGRAVSALGLVLGVAAHLHGAAGHEYAASCKDAVLAFYAEHVVGAKRALPAHTVHALDAFCAAYVGADDLDAVVFPALDKMLLRSPEYALRGALLCASARIDGGAVLQRLRTPLAAAAASANAATRAGALQLVRALAARTERGDALAAFVDAACASVKPSESRPEDQRASQFALLGALPAHAAWSARVCDTLAPLVRKETLSAPLRAALDAMWTHAAALLRADAPVSDAALDAFSGKLTGPKAPLRAAAMLSLVRLRGHAPFTPTCTALWMHFVPLLEKGVGGAGGGALVTGDATDGIAFLDALDPDHSSPPALRARVAASAAVGTLLQTAPKLSFLLQDRVARRMRDAGDLPWHARALAAAVRAHGRALAQDEALWDAVEALLPIYLTGGAVDEAVRILEDVADADARVAFTFLSAASSAAPFPTAKPAPSHASFGAPLLRRLLRIPVGTHTERAGLLVELLVLAHIPELQDADRQCFVQLCRAASADPRAVLTENSDAALAAVRAAQADPALAGAADAALGTAVFIAPDVLPAVVRGVLADAAPGPLDALSDADVAVWQAPPGVVHVDAARDAAPAKPAGASSSLERWDAEVRASLAQKKERAGARSREQKAAVAAQLARERAQRRAVDAVRAPADAALRAIGALGASAADVGAHRAVCAFVVSVLVRRVDAALVPLDYALEDMDAVTVRVLYQLRFLADVQPLSVGAAGLVVPWLAELAAETRLCGDEGADDAAAERLQLILEVLAAHAGCAGADAFPLDDAVRALLALTHVPLLAREAAGALSAYGEALARLDAGGGRGGPDGGRGGESGGTALPLLLDAVLAEERGERSGALQCVRPLDLTELAFCAPLWLVRHDADTEVAAAARAVWEENALDVPETYVDALVPYLAHAHANVRASAPAALGDACRMHPGTLGALRAALEAVYEGQNYSLAPEYDQFGMVIDATLAREDPWHVRAAVAAAMEQTAPLLHADDVPGFMAFVLRRGAALGDRSATVREAFLDAAAAVVDGPGRADVRGVIAQLERWVGGAARRGGDEEARTKTGGSAAAGGRARSPSPAPGGDTDDAVAEAAVVLLGRAARHLGSDDAHVRVVVDRLLDALQTPSESVQAAVAACLPALVRRAAVAQDVPALVDGLFAQLLHGATYAGRRGAAYGLAGVVAGRGIGSVRTLRVLERLADAVQDTSAAAPRQGALFAYETLAGTLRGLFEPYVGGVLPQLLVCFGDAHADVREATQEAARVLMRSISGHCLKVVLPSLLAGLDEKQWRTKRGAIELLGAMAYCAPRQLSAALPAVIPRLSDVLTDSHTQVRTAANRSLKQFGEVIHNPEIHALVPTLLRALVDPNAKTGAALRALLGTTFVHYIDAPSLALVAPVLERGLRERSVSAQKHAAQIVGSLASLTDTRDLVPYLRRYTPLVRGVLVSPVPDARGVAAKALGTLVERLGEGHFPELVPALLHVLQTDATGVDRHGAAQGLAEVLAGLGMERMERLLPRVVDGTRARAPYVREGHLALLIYLPATFGARFAPHLPRVVPPIMASIADDVESVREASLRAGRMLITHYEQRAVDLLLPQLEPRLFDGRWRVRLSALELLGELLFRVAGISGRADAGGAYGDEDAGPGEAVDAPGDAAEARAEAGAPAGVPAHGSVQRALLAALGADLRNRLLAAIYILRQDPNIPVRHSAAHTWKAVVHNTPRTAREVLPAMLDLILAALAAAGAEQREMAGRTLGELVRKLGEKILHETTPLLAARARDAPSPSTRAGVCLAVTDILANATKTQLEDHEEPLLAIVRGALVDAAPAVRAAAAHAFDAVQAHLGSRAIDSTLPTLLDALDARADHAATALAALREVVRTRPDVVFPLVVPALAQVPVSVSHARALCALVPVAGSALSAQLAAILASLARTLLDLGDDAAPVRAEVDAAVDATFAAVADIDALHQTMLVILAWLSSREGPARRVLACEFLVRFCAVKADGIAWDDYTVVYVRKLVALMDDDEGAGEVLHAAHAALGALFQRVGKDVWGGLVVSSAEQREQGALGLADIVEKTSTDAVKPFVTTIVGPLIRLCGDRHPPPVKTAILSSLDTMVQRVPQLVRPFYPQLQRSFQKALADPSSGTVRATAGAALGRLMAQQTRVEPVVLELVQGVRTALDGNADAAAVGDAHALALARVLEHVPADRVSDAARTAVAAALEDAFHAPEEPREPLKRALAETGAALVRLPHAADGVLERCILRTDPVDVQLAALMLHACVGTAPDALYAAVHPPSQVAQLATTWTSEAPSVARPARETRDLLRRVSPWSVDDGVQAAL